MAVFRLSEKISITVFLLIIVFGGMATASTFLLTKKILLEKAEEEFSTIGPYRSYAASQLIRNYQNKAVTLAMDPVVIDFVKRYEVNPKESKISNEELLSHDSTNASASIYILDKNGIGIASTDQRFLKQNYSFRDYYKKAILGNNHVEIALGVTTNEMGYYFSSPIIDNNLGSVLGVAVIKLRPEILSKELFGTVPADYEFSLVDDFGVVVLSTERSKLYKSLGKLSEEDMEKLRESGKFGSKKIDELDYPELMLLMPEVGTSSSKLIDLEDKSDGKREIVTLYKVENTSFYLLVEQDISFLGEVSFRSAALVASFVAIAALAVIILISYIIKVFLSPLNKISDLAKRIGEGKEVDKIVVKNNDEIGELTEVINYMSEQLSEYKNSMEMKVRERTSEIEKTMDLMLGRELRMMELKKENQKLKVLNENAADE